MNWLLRNKHKFIYSAIGVSLVAIVIWVLSALFSQSSRWYSLVPTDAVAVVEAPSFNDNLAPILELKPYAHLKEIRLLGQIEKKIKPLDSLIDTFRKSIYKDARFSAGFSVHVDSIELMSRAYYLQTSNAEAAKFFYNHLISYLTAQNVTQRQVIIEGKEVLAVGSGGEGLYLMVKGSVVVGSPSRRLLGKIIKRENGEKAVSFIENAKNNIAIADRSGPHLRLFINHKHPALVYLGKEVTGNAGNPGLSSFFDLSASDEGLLMVGTTLTQARSARHFLNVFATIPIENSTGFYRMTANNTAVAYHFGIGSAESFNNRVQKFYRVVTGKDYNEQADALSLTYNFHPKNTFGWQGHHAGMLIDKNGNTFAVIETSNPKAANDQLDAAYRLLDDQSEATQRKYKQYVIKEVPPTLPALLLGPWFNSFAPCYYTIAGNYVVFGNKISALKQYLNQIDNEQVWARTVRYSLLLEKLPKNQAFELLINQNLIGDVMLLKKLPPIPGLSPAKLLKNFDFAAFQFTQKKPGNIATNLQLFYKDNNRNEDTPDPGYQKQSDVFFEDNLTGTPHIVRNYTDKSLETLVQDAQNNLYVIAANGKFNFARKINKPIKTEVFQVDRYKNNKLQYCFATTENVYLIDKNGDNVKYFPFSLPNGKTIAHVAVIDYDGSKNYRLAANTPQGDIYLYDLEANNLEGWQPRSTGQPPTGPLQHTRIGTKDALICLGKQGKLHVIQRNGENYPGFPLELNDTFDTQPFVASSSSFKTSRLYMLSTTGQLYVVNFEGAIITAKTIFKDSQEAKFFLLTTPHGRDFALVRYKNGQAVVMNKALKTIVKISNPDIVKPAFQYYEFGNKKIIVMRDTEKELAYLYDQNGDLLNKEPVFSSADIALLYFSGSGTYRVYRNFGRRSGVLSF